MSTLWRLLDPETDERLRAVRATDSSDGDAAFALRDVLLGDTHAPVRAAAAERLAKAGPMAAPWLTLALDDTHASVREAAARGCARTGGDVERLERASEHERRSCERKRERLERACEHERRSCERKRERLERACEHEPVWWVRRACVRALGASAGTAAVPTLLRVLEDPFWRVRHAAVQALDVLGAEDADVRAAVLDHACASHAARAAVELLRQGWGGEPGPDAPSWIGEEQGEGPLDDADPAVVTARVLNGADADDAELIRMLADAHAALRAAASERLRARVEVDGVQILRLALHLLDEPGPPHAADAIRGLLAPLGGAARPLAEAALSGEVAGAACWAAAWIAQRREADLYPQLIALAADPRPRVRAVTATALGAVAACELGAGQEVAGLLRTLLGLLDDAERWVRDAAARALLAVEVPEVREALDSAELPFDVSAARVEAAERRGDLDPARAALRAERAAGAGIRGAHPAVRAAGVSARSAHPAVRAAGVSALSRAGALSDDDRQVALGDADPWVRRAALDVASAVRALAPATQSTDEPAGDPDPSVRREAARLLVARRRDLPPSLRRKAGGRAAVDPDPWIRARAARLLQVEDDVESLLALSADPEHSVRIAAADPLDACPDLRERLRAWLAGGGGKPRPYEVASDPVAGRGGGKPRPYEVSSDPASYAAEASDPVPCRGGACPRPSRKAAYTWLVRERDAAAEVDLREGLTHETDPAVRDHLAALGVLFGDDPPLQAPVTREARPARPVADVPQRRLADGIDVAPLVLSGVHGLSHAALGAAVTAGVNTVFYEPHHPNLAAFLRRPARRDLRVIAGTYHADRAGIRRDVHAALRRLDQEALDVFLLFWARSPARLDAEAFEVLAELKREGKIKAAGFSTHLRDLAQAALRAHPWDVVMTRHSAAHPGAEDALLPLARERGVGVLAFSALCYGRLLRRTGDDRAPTAPECYRYCLSQPGVSAVISAPRRWRELEANLTVLADPSLDPEAQERLRAHGRIVRAKNRRFNTLMRRAGGPSPHKGLVRERLEDLVAHRDPIDAPCEAGDDQRTSGA